MSKETKDLIVGLDIGTSKIVAIVAELDPEGQLLVLGRGSQDSEGLKKGMVVNIEATVNSISRAIQEVELMTGCKVTEVYTGIAGGHIKSKDSNGMAVVRDKEVTQYDVERAIEAANATPISADDQILHTLVQEFIVDGQDGVKEPIGMDARRLEVKVHLVTGAVTAVQNIVKCVHRCGLEVVDLVLQPLASGHAVLTEDEKDVGVCLVDIGGGTTDVAIFTQGAIRHTAVIPIAGDQMTSDIAIALRTSTQDAEEIKIS
ncbi:MAG TPA: cell division protein FtsA, partial [Rhodocyclaceae bacterium]